MTIAAIGAIAGTSPTIATSAPTATAATNPSGVDFASVLDPAQQTTSTADSLASQVATGNASSIQDFTSAAAKASLTVDLVVAIRNRAVDAYQEIMRMSV